MMSEQEYDALIEHSERNSGEHSAHHLINTQNWLKPLRTQRVYIQSTRSKVKQFLSSKAGHYSVLALVILDVAGIFAGT
jgi:hypothetical protein